VKLAQRHWEIRKLLVERECTRCKRVTFVAWSYTPNQKRFFCFECWLALMQRGER